MSKARRVDQPTQPRLTRSSLTQARHADSLGPQASPAGVGLAQDLSLMSVNEQEATSRADMTSRKVKPSKQPAVKTPAPRKGLEPVAELMKSGRCRNIVVVVGAGISTPSGIPDFRTPGTGLYANVERYNIPYPEALFNIDYFSDNPQPFFSLAKELYPGLHRPNYIHYFIHTLHLQGLLLRVYTQNIDGLEKMCGIPEEKLVEAHGSFETASCHLCYTPFPAQEAKKAIMSDIIPTCSFCQGAVKPDVVFFGEDLPQKYFLHSTDFPKADLLIIMGTSLQIEPFASLVNTVRASTPRLLMNRNPVGPFLGPALRRRDYIELGDLEHSVRRLAQMLGWDRQIETLMSADQRTSPAIPISITDHQGGARESRPEEQGPISSQETDSRAPSFTELSHESHPGSLSQVCTVNI